MADISLTEDNSEKILTELQKRKIQALTMCGMEAEKYAKLSLTQNKAVDTGLLRNSVTFAVSGEGANISSYKADKGGKTGSYNGDAGSVEDYTMYVGTNVEYAPYIEFGTGKHYSGGGRKTKWTYKTKDGLKTTDGKKPRPYIKPAIADHGDKYKKIIEKVLKG